MDMKIAIKICCFSLLFFLSHYVAYSQSIDSTTLAVMKSDDFPITGDGTASNWNRVSWVTLPQRNTGPVTYQTKLKLLYSDSGIYCLYYCEDNKITATLQEDFSNLYNEDVVEAFFWTDETLPLYFEYEVSPLNYELPILVPNNKGNFLGWLPWHYEGDRRTRHAVHINKEGDKISSWSAEFFIPFKLLKPLNNVPPSKGSRWRANFYRIDYDSGVTDWSWQLTRTTFHDYEKFGTIVFE
jgi:hypothetical protein